MQSKTKFSLALLVMLSGSGMSYAEVATCADLSFAMSGGLVEWRQVGCEKFHIVAFDFDGTVLSEKDILFSDQFETINVDDLDERYSSRQRWMWSRSGQALIHEATFDKFIKASSERVFSSLSEVISMSPDKKVQRVKSQILRVEKADGNAAVESKDDTRVFDRL